MLTTKKKMLFQAGVTGLGTAAGLVAFAGLSKKMKKPYIPALVGGGVAAVVSLLWNLLDTYVIEKELGVASKVADEMIESGQMSKLISSGAAEAEKALAGAGLAGLGLTHAQRKRLGLFNVQKVGLIEAQRMGLYVPEPSVKKFNNSPGVRYYS